MVQSLNVSKIIAVHMNPLNGRRICQQFCRKYTKQLKVHYMIHRTSRDFRRKILKPFQFSQLAKVLYEKLRNDFHVTELKIILYNNTKPFKFDKTPFVLYSLHIGTINTYKYNFHFSL